MDWRRRRPSRRWALGLLQASTLAQIGVACTLMRGWLTAVALMATLSLASSTYASEVQTVWVGTERRPFGLLLVSPTSQVGGLTHSEVALAFAAGLERNTRFRVRFEDTSARMTECSGKLECLCASLSRAGIRFFAVLSNVPGPGGTSRLSATLVDVAMYQVDPAKGVTRSRDHTIASPQESTSYLGRLAELEFAGPLAKAGRWEAPERIDVRVVKDATVLLDDAVVARSSGQTVRLLGAKPGRYTIGVRHDAYLPFEAEVVLARGVAVELVVELERPWAATRHGVFWAGAVTAAAGLGLTTYGAVQGASTADGVCFGTGQSALSSGQSRPFTTLDGAEGRGGSILTAPLGYALLAVGVAPILAALLSDEEWAQWLGLGSGLVAGGLAYGLSAGLESAPACQPR